MHDVTTWLSPRFWGNVLRGTVNWAVTALPRVLIVLLLAFVLLKVLNLLLKKVAHRAHRESNLHGKEELALVEHQKRTETLLEIVGNTGRLVIWVSVVMLMLSQVGMNIAPLIASAGVVGLAIGFGAQELVRDMITGFFMLLENQIRVGDVVTVNGTSGNVERMTMRTVVLRDSTGAVHIFQNGKISTLANLTKDWSAEVMDIGVAYKEDTDRVVEVMRDVAETMQGDDAFRESMLEPIEVFGVDAFKESSVVIKARIKTRPSDQWKVAREYRRRLKKAFEAESIEMPFPHQTIHWGESSPPFKVESASVPAARPRAASAS